MALSMFWSLNANLMASRSFQVAGQIMSFYRVLSIDVRPKDEDFYQSVDSDSLFPRRQQARLTL